MRRTFSKLFTLYYLLMNYLILKKTKLWKTLNTLTYHSSLLTSKQGHCFIHSWGSITPSPSRSELSVSCGRTVDNNLCFVHVLIFFKGLIISLITVSTLYYFISTVFLNQYCLSSYSYCHQVASLITLQRYEYRFLSVWRLVMTNPYLERSDTI